MWFQKWLRNRTLETELNNLKSQNKIKPVKGVEVTKEPRVNQKEVFEQRKGIVDENIMISSEEINLVITEDIIKTPKAVFKCEIYGNTFKKEISSAGGSPVNRVIFLFDYY